MFIKEFLPQYNTPDYMRRKKTTLLIFLFIVVKTNIFSQTIWTIGPMLHINFGGDKPHISYAIESSYWDLSHFYYGVDAGFEFEPKAKKTRIYSEIQTGFGLAGIALGPLLEINRTEKKIHLGIQTSIWGNYFIGVDLRKRWVDKTKYRCAGLYLKIPFADHGFSDSNGNNSSHHYHHFGD